MPKLTLADLIGGASGVSIPSWADAMAMLTLFDLEYTDVELNVAPAQLLLPADPMRWAVGFLGPTIGVAANTVVGPWATLTVFGLVPTTAAITWVTLFGQGAIPSLAWYGQSSLAQPLRVFSMTYRGGRDE